MRLICAFSFPKFVHNYTKRYCRLLSREMRIWWLQLQQNVESILVKFPAFVITITHQLEKFSLPFIFVKRYVVKNLFNSFFTCWLLCKLNSILFHTILYTLRVYNLRSNHTNTKKINKLLTQTLPLWQINKDFTLQLLKKKMKNKIAKRKNVSSKL